MIQLKDLLNEDKFTYLSKYLRYVKPPFVKKLHAFTVTTNEQTNNKMYELEFSWPDDSAYYIKYNATNDEYEEILRAGPTDNEYDEININELQRNNPNLYDSLEKEWESLSDISFD